MATYKVVVAHGRENVLVEVEAESDYAAKDIAVWKVTHGTHPAPRRTSDFHPNVSEGLEMKGP